MNGSKSICDKRTLRILMVWFHPCQANAREASWPVIVVRHTVGCAICGWGKPHAIFGSIAEERQNDLKLLEGPEGGGTKPGKMLVPKAIDADDVDDDDDESSDSDDDEVPMLVLAGWQTVGRLLLLMSNWRRN